MPYSVIILLSCILLFACNSGENSEGNVQEQNQTEEKNAVVNHLNASEFQSLIESGEGVLIDVRTPGEFAEGAIPDAQLINIKDGNFVEQVVAISREKEVYLYCRSGRRSSRAAHMMLDEGFTQVYNLDGGILAWQKQGFPVNKGSRHE